MKRLITAVALITAIALPARAEATPDPIANKDLLLALKEGQLRGGSWTGTDPEAEPCSFSIKWPEKNGNPVLYIHTTIMRQDAITRSFSARIEDTLRFEDLTVTGKRERNYRFSRISLTSIPKQPPAHYSTYYIQREPKRGLTALLIEEGRTPEGQQKRFACGNLKARPQQGS